MVRRPEHQTTLARDHPVGLVFMDESGAISQDRFFVVGILKLMDNPAVLLRRVQHLRDRENWHQEFHFASVTEGALPAYRQLVDLVAPRRGCEFACFVADKDVADPVSRFGTHWEAYEKLAEQLLHGRTKPFEVLSVIADNYSTPRHVQFEAMVRERVNRRLRRMAVSTVIRSDSRASDGLQIVDVLTSAIAFEFRQSAGLAGYGNAKDKLAQHVRKAFDVNAFTDVPVDLDAFSVRMYDHGDWNGGP